ncbi:MAG: DUF4130 domain-containing protein [Candidatus Hodarchaeota archaeon]
MLGDKSPVVVFNSTFKSLLATALICEALGVKAVHKDCFNPHMISEENPVIQTDGCEESLSFGEALKVYEERRGDFPLYEVDLSEIESLIEWSLRYKKGDNSKFALALKVLKQCLVEGLDIVLSQVTWEGREIYKRVRRVQCECHKGRGFLRLKVVGRFLVGEAEFEHEVEDLVVKFWSERYPRKIVVLFSKGKREPMAYIGSKGDVYLVKGENVNSLRNLIKETGDKVINTDDSIEKNKEIEKIYETFYDVHYIPSRRNKKLASQFIPKKFAKQFKMKEGIKIECGIQKTKLDLFLSDQLDYYLAKCREEKERNKS